MSDLLSLGPTIRYGSWTFGIKTSSSVRVTPVPDEAARTITHSQMIFDVRSWIVDQSTTDSFMETLRRQLTKQADEFEYRDAGFGTLKVNTADGVKDVKWGPKPVHFDCRPVGGKRAWRIEWSVEVNIPDQCSNARGQGFPMAYNYDVTVRTDGNGYSTRTIDGYIEIPITRNSANDRTIPDDADRFLESITPPIPFGFKREDQTRRLTSDRRRLKFAFVDRELPPGGLPENATGARGTHTIQPSSPMNFNQWMGTMQAAYTIARDRPQQYAWLAFLTLIDDRLKWSLSQSQNVYLSDFRVTEGLYEDSDKHQFAVSYLLGTSLPSILTASGLWRVIPGTQFGKWAQSVSSVTGPRGSAGIKFDAASMDGIVDLCISNETREMTATGLGKPGSSTLTAVTNPGVSVLQSWLKYENVIDVEVAPNAVVLKSLPLSALKHEANPLGDSQANAVGKPPAPGESNVPNFEGKYAKITSSPKLKITGQLVNNMQVQQRATPDVYVTMRGYAMRAGWHAPIPSLTALGSSPLIAEEPQWINQRIKANFGGTLIYLSEWVLRYRVQDPSSAVIPVPQDPSKKAGG